MISIYKPNSNLVLFGIFLEGDELRVCYNTKTKIPARLARVMVETLSGNSRLSRVRSSYGSGNRVKPFSLSGGDRISQVRPG
jgi:hypothetical protein